MICHTLFTSCVRTIVGILLQTLDFFLISPLFFFHLCADPGYYIALRSVLYSNSTWANPVDSLDRFTVKKRTLINPPQDHVGSEGS